MTSRLIYFILAASCILLNTRSAQAKPWWNSEVEKGVEKSSEFLAKISPFLPYQESTLELRPRQAQVDSLDGSVEFDILSSSAPQSSDRPVGWGKVNVRTGLVTDLEFYPIYPNTSSVMSNAALNTRARLFVSLVSTRDSYSKTPPIIKQTSDHGLKRFLFVDSIENILTSALELDLQVWSADISSYHLQKRQGLPSKILASPSKAQVERIFKKLITYKYSSDVLEIEKINLSRNIEKLQNDQYGYYWNAGTTIKLKNGVRKLIDASLNEGDNHLSYFNAQPWHDNLFNSNNENIVHESWPSWSNDGQYIVSVTDRRWDNYPSYADHVNSLCIIPTARNKEIQILRPLFERGWPTGSYDQPSMASGIDSIMFAFSSNTCEVNLNTGVVLLQSSEHRTAKNATISHSGKMLSFVTQRNNDDQDVYLARASDSMRSASSQWCLARSEGQDSLPVFSDDDKQVAFLNTKLVNGSSISRNIFIVNSQNKGVTIPVRCFSNIPYQVTRISWFPDNQRLLLSTDNKINPIFICDLKLKRLFPSKLTALHDSESLNSKIVQIKDAAVDITGKKIAFSGLLVTGKGVISGSYIYTCDVDGSHVRRLTPLTSLSEKIYKFSPNNTIYSPIVKWATGIQDAIPMPGDSSFGVLHGK